MEVANWQLVLGSNCLIRCVLVYSPTKGVELYSVLPRGGPWSKCPLARGMAPPEEFSAGSCTPNPAPLPPHARGRGGTTRGSSASQPPVVFRPYPPWVVGTGSGGEFLAPNSPLGPPPVLLAAGGFLGRREGQESVGFCPLGGAHQSAWSLYIVLGHTPRRRRPAGLEQPFKTSSAGGHSERAPKPRATPPAPSTPGAPAASEVQDAGCANE
jgi:hypothetical protein